MTSLPWPPNPNRADAEAYVDSVSKRGQETFSDGSCRADRRDTSVLDKNRNFVSSKCCGRQTSLPFVTIAESAVSRVLRSSSGALGSSLSHSDNVSATGPNRRPRPTLGRGSAGCGGGGGVTMRGARDVDVIVEAPSPQVREGRGRRQHNESRNDSARCPIMPGGADRPPHLHRQIRLMDPRPSRRPPQMTWHCVPNGVARPTCHSLHACVHRRRFPSSFCHLACPCRQAAPPPARVLLLEPFYGGSHKQLLDLLSAHLDSCVAFTAPAKKWHWKARTSALDFSQRVTPNPAYRWVTPPGTPSAP